jgi:hypothetical protein
MAQVVVAPPPVQPPVKKPELKPETYQIGVSRPPLVVDDLPVPEQVFKVPKIGFKQVVTLVIGPSMVALGISIGSGEWLLGPLSIASYGFTGIGTLILISAVLQTFYNVEVSRFVLATGEVPVQFFGRVPPGYIFWVPFAIFCFYMAFLWGGWAASAGQVAFPILFGKAPVMTPQGDLWTVRWIAFALMAVVFIITLFGKKISRTMELVSSAMVVFILVSLFIFVVLFVPPGDWVAGFVSMITPSLPPHGTDATLIGGLVGFTACAAGLNWYVLGYYRDHGYGMGSKIGAIAGMIGGKQEQVLPSGRVFRENEKNTALWKRWFRLLVVDQWCVFFVGAILGMMLPSIFVGWLSHQPGAAQATCANMPVYAAMEMSRKFGGPFFLWTALVGFGILFSTQLGVFENLVRNLVDALYGMSATVRKAAGGDVRKVYYPAMVVLGLFICWLITAALPGELILISSNMSNFASIFFPLCMIYLNTKLPKPARSSWWAHAILILNVLFFGFFFLNFAVKTLTGQPLVTF